MARTSPFNHYRPDIHDEGKIKRYGMMITIVVLAIVLALFVAWATYFGLRNQFGPGGPSSPPESGRPQS
jgi:hypothetical protein